ncbi:MAG: DNA polymerase IV [Clostridia bacterium]|nr:DNA polymerase IV [Clostridia bacterium]
MEADRTILHCDANNFYASVECAKNPALKGYPIAVCGDPEKRHGIILAKSTEAKKFGIITGEAIWQAKAKCKDLILVPPDYTAYVWYSNALFALYASYTDRVESFGLDECWLDVTGSRRLFGDGKTIADAIRQKSREQLGITVSVGVSHSKIFAKLGSDYKKPDATTEINRDNYKKIAWELPVGELMMVGRKTVVALEKMGIRTIGELAKTNIRLLSERFGIVGEKLYDYANGNDNEEVSQSEYKSIPESVGNGSTAARDMMNMTEVKTLIIALCELVATRLRKYSLRANGLHLTVKDNSMSHSGKQLKTLAPINSASELIHYAITLLKELWNEKTGLPIRAITVTAINLIGDNEGYQQNMFKETADKSELIEKSIDEIRSKYGYEVIKRGSLMLNTFVTDKIIDDMDFKPFKRN